MKLSVIPALALLLLVARGGPVSAEEPAPSIQAGSRVSLEYTLRDEGGAVLDTNTGKAPLEYTQGSEQILPALEKALVGLHAGDRKKVTIAPAAGYGEIDPSALTEVPKDRVPADALVVGTELVARTAAGQTRVVRVKEIKPETVVLDLNHPLAGKTLEFDVKIVGVEPPGK
jgi:FKBP-type peptidyl-prolyl cis-trans isomerase SlyD